MSQMLSFSYSTKQDADNHCLRLGGYFGFLDVKEVREIAQRQIKQLGLRQLRLDLAALEDMDSSALSCLIDLHDEAKRRHCMLNFVCTPGKVRDKLQSAANVNNLQVQFA